MNAVGVKPLRVELEPVGKMLDNVRRFEGYGGRDLVIELFKKAGLTGLWKLRMFDTFKSSGRTPSVQVRRPDTHGVIIWWKPGSNDSGMRSELLVTKDTGMSPDQVYHKLKAAAEGNAQGPPPPNDDRDYAMIRLVNRANAASWEMRDAFVGDIHGQLVKRPVEGLKVNVLDDTHEILEDMADRGLLYEDGNVFRVGRLGQELQYRMEEAQRPADDPAPQVPQAAPAPAPPSHPMDPLEALKAYQAQLARLANLPAEVEKIRQRRIEIGNEVSKLRSEDEQLAADEKRLLSIDVEALALLLGPPPKEK
jgi:hypothetical protein